ncbi:hypothetical protein, partial [Novosphingobium rosa]|uniref:hypothetical protein n=1 Tax=Novosphingobium rosa TaxID=76978 RepID=UPI001C3F6010
VKSRKIATQFSGGPKETNLYMATARHPKNSLVFLMTPPLSGFSTICNNFNNKKRRQSGWIDAFDLLPDGFAEASPSFPATYAAGRAAFA